MQKSELIKKVKELEEEIKKEAVSNNLELIQELANTRAGIPGNLLKQYDRLKKKLKDPIVRMKNGVCQGCFMSFSLGTALVAHANKSIHICEHCGRLVYIEKEEE